MAKNRKRISRVLITTGVLIACIGIVVFMTFQRVRHTVATQQSRFEIPSETSPQAIVLFARTLHVGPQLSSADLKKTLHALDRSAHLLSDSLPGDSEAINEVARIRCYYRAVGLRRGTIDADSVSIAEHCQDFCDRIRSHETFPHEDLETLTLTLHLLGNQFKHQEAALSLLEQLEQTTISRLEAPYDRQFATNIKGIRNRLQLIGTTIDLQGETFDGKVVDVTDYRGQVLLVEFWSTGCAPCVQELPKLKSIYAEYRDQGFEVIGLPTDPYPGRLEAFVIEHEIEWPQIFQREMNLERMQQWGITSIPSSLLLDRQGRVIALDVRATSPDSEKRLLTHLKIFFANSDGPDED